MRHVFSRNFLLFALLFAAVLAALLFIGITASQRFTKITDSLISPERLSFPKAEVERIRALLGETELALKAYTLTKDDEFLDDYYFNCFEIMDEFEQFESNQASYEPAIRSALDTLDTLVFERLALFEGILTSGDEFRVERAMNQVNSIVTKYNAPVKRDSIIQTNEPPSVDDSQGAKSGLKGLFRQRKKDEETNNERSKHDNVAVPPSNNRKSLNASIQGIAARERNREAAIRGVLLQISQDGKQVNDRIDRIVSLISNAEFENQEREARNAAALATASKNAVRWGIAAAILLVFVFGLMLYFQVRSAQKLAAAQRQASDHALSLANAKESFVTNVSHELRTPLNAILGFTELIEDTKDNGERLDFIKRVKHSAYHLNDLIRDLLDWSKMESGKFTFNHVKFSPRQVVDEVSEMTRFSAKSGKVDFIVHTNIASDFLIGDPLRLKQILINLLGNAFKFTDKGKVRMSVSEFKSERESHWFRFVVKDTGKGIPEEKMDMIFGEFEQVEQGMNRKFEGSGLGLAITKKLVEGLGGTITITSELNKGTEVTCEIPFAHNAQPTTNANSDVPNFERLSALIVDDHPFNLELLSAFLSKTGCRVTKADKASRALELLATNTFDIGIFDIVMPEMDGFELVHRIPKDVAAEMTLIALTAATSDQVLEKCKKCGFSAVLAKPIQRELLWKKIETLVQAKNGQITKNYDLKLNPVNTRAVENGLVINEALLRHVFDDDSDFRNEMLSAFVESIAVELPILKEAVTKNNASKSDDVIHKILPSCRQIGAERMTEALESLRECLKKNASTDVCRPKLENVEKTYVELNRSINQLINSSST